MKKVIVYFTCGNTTELICCEEDEAFKVINEAKRYFKSKYFTFNAAPKKKFILFFWKDVTRIAIVECDCENCI